MKLIYFLLSVCVFIAQPLRAQSEPLRVAVDPVNPPFVMRGANNQLYGYDVSMMEYICKTIQRPCQFIPTRFDKMLHEVSIKKVDVATSSITITAERSKMVNFSFPYLLSKTRFVGPKKLANQSFGRELLNYRKIGITEGSIYPDFLLKMEVIKPIIISYTNSNNLIEALNRGEINFGLMDEPTALYWQSHSAQKFAVLGPSFSYGFGLGIAVNKDNLTLLQSINNALLKYQESDDFKRNYNAYMARF
ncbi:transporter substrate-binding domain-containing protein [Legionella longbeachae]|uniref:Putative amino acid ABC transporter, periplasmic binding protein n=1 Tax=Legionella longbeachae serogroup 1 (strain NSW150) TaxID=661367 RepID=D3HTV6_LEGLN|nr:transporter substrate-binding domain-containing protein [Legionella longbeachae]EEZ94852.1 bacterial extracellular solute-binding protein [Legionella longbeachae D-4968]QIN34171.1 transporter substrate-binding domain-containing protein [Legionella longbeachae]CBJ13964.1 putative amino acid ABC transporter, periplasmic binding protein [Legionella longbeachae NSW150]HBD7399137.1 transporter substrate-binding domain-containing protein [Legionella pneumophila]